MALHPDVQTLLDAMRALEAHLSGHDAFWAEKVGRAADEVARSDAHGLERFWSFFGGAGSLNDLVLHHDGRARIEENEALDALRRRAWTLALDLKLATR